VKNLNLNLDLDFGYWILDIGFGFLQVKINEFCIKDFWVPMRLH
jgi:hypothetical protein